MAMITAIMPTMIKRRRLLPASLRTFARQTYGDARLLIGLDEDGGTAHMTHLIDMIGADLGIRDRIDIITIDAPNLGTKRNAMCDAVKTPWIAFWDDDDWHAPSRLEATIDAIERNEALRPFSVGPMLIGSQAMLIHEILDPRRRTFTYRWQGAEPYFVGGLLCFERSLWEQNPFPSEGESAHIGDEAWWQLSLPRDVFRFEFTTTPTLYCAFIHRLNTANTQAPNGDRSWELHREGHHAPLAMILDDELGVWEEAHHRVLVDPLVFGSVGGHVVSSS